MAKAPEIIFGTAGVAQWSPDTLNEVLSILKKHNVDHLDTAYIYAGSEETLAKYSAPSNFTIDSKAPGFTPGALSKQSVLDGLTESLRRLNSSSIETYYLHSPDTTTPIEETLEAITTLHEKGSFKQFGLSNFKPAEVQKIYDIQSKKGAVLPTVFQGNYNAVSRHIETDLFPVLRKLKIAFYAYSPIAGGFLVKDPEVLRKGAGEGRWAKDTMVGGLYSGLYLKESLLSALEEWSDIAKEEGISKAALAYRWIAFHSALDKAQGDAIIVGASKPSQLEESLAAIEQGPLNDKSVKRIEDVWSKVEGEAPRDNYHG